MQNQPTDQELREWFQNKRAQVKLDTSPLPQRSLSSSNLKRSDLPEGLKSASQKTRPDAVIFAAKAPSAWECPACATLLSYRKVNSIPTGSIYTREHCPCEITEQAQRESVEQTRRADARELAQRIRLRAAWEQSGITPELAARYSFETFDPSRSGKQANALALAQGWATDYQRGARGLALTGEGCGIGKTHLLIAACAFLLGRGVSVLFTTLPDLLDGIRREFGGQPIEQGKTLELARSVDVLAIDDLGAERIAEGEKGDWVREQLFRLVDSRSLHQRTICLTSNLKPADIEDRIGGLHGARILSRLAGLAIWREMGGPDGRILAREGGAK